MKKSISAAGIVALVLVGCSAPQSTAQEDVLDEFNLTGKDGAEVIEHLDQLPLEERPGDLMGSVQPDELVLTTGAEQISMETPEDYVYVSIAPYVGVTHDCFYHSLTTCTGEMSEEPIDVEIVDESTGETIVDEEAETYANGFIGYWLPSDTSVDITISHEDGTGSTQFSTANDGPTCVTDLQLTA